MMVYVPYLKREDVNPTRAGVPNHPVVWRAGLHDAAMIVVVREFIDA